LRAEGMTDFRTCSMNGGAAWRSRIDGQ
jgi:hypothetical protein